MRSVRPNQNTKITGCEAKTKMVKNNEKKAVVVKNLGRFNT